MTDGPASGTQNLSTIAAMGGVIVLVGLAMIFKARAIHNWQLQNATGLRLWLLRGPGQVLSIRMTGIAILGFGLIFFLGIARALFPDFEILPGFLDRPPD